MAEPLSVPKRDVFLLAVPCRVVTPYGAALGIQPWRLGKETPREGRCPRGWGQAPCGYQQNKRARIALGASHSRGSWRCRPLLGFFLFGGFFSPLLLLHDSSGSCLRTPGRAAFVYPPLRQSKRGDALGLRCRSVISQVLCIPRQEISGAKRRLFVTYRRALCRARLLKAIWCLRCPDLWFPSLILGVGFHREAKNLV